jgi:GNAT superfamily N-acetyltransferase
VEIDYEDEIAFYPVWVAVSSGEIAGGLILMFEDDYTTIANIAVHPDYQGQGLGRGLMAFAENEARSRGYQEMHLVTHVLLPENVLFYLKLGWTESSRDETRVYMIKNI